VEDDVITREGLATFLTRSGYEVVLSDNGQDALDYLRVGPKPDLILLDMLMPVLDGWRFLDKVRAGGVPAVPILVITATVLSREWAEDHGCCGFVRKPIDTPVLLEEIRRCVAA
jgi:CheY-like chemotaxis protein